MTKAIYYVESSYHGSEYVVAANMEDAIRVWWKWAGGEMKKAAKACDGEPDPEAPEEPDAVKLIASAFLS